MTNNNQNNQANNSYHPLDPLLDRGLSNRLTLILGPDAGERSKALNEWLARRDYPTLQIEHPNGETGEVCFQGIIDAFVAAGILDEPPAEFNSDNDCQTTLILLINRLAELDRDLLIIFRDYEPCEVGDSVLSFLLEHLPQQVHLYVCTEDAPGLSCIPRLRVRRQLQTIDTSNC
jgi:LuxR family maltose regulon positive regulatory protein